MTLPAKLAALASGFGVLGCAGLLGIDEEQDDVAGALCVCPDAIQSFGGVACAKYVAARLETATPATRSAWMKKFESHCSSSCNGCWDNVFHERPTCTDPGDDCVNAECNDCCNPTANGAGQCA